MNPWYGLFAGLAIVGLALILGLTLLSVLLWTRLRRAEEHSREMQTIATSANELAKQAHIAEEKSVAERDGMTKVIEDFAKKPLIAVMTNDQVENLSSTLADRIFSMRPNYPDAKLS